MTAQAVGRNIANMMRPIEIAEAARWCALNDVHLRYIKDASKVGGEHEEAKAVTAVRQCGMWANRFLNAIGDTESLRADLYQQVLISNQNALAAVQIVEQTRRHWASVGYWE